MFEDELRQLLREFALSSGAQAATILVSEPTAATAAVEPGAADWSSRKVPLGGGAYLEASFHGPTREPEARAAAMERAARSLRACARRWHASEFPAVRYPQLGGAPRERVLARIHAFLHAFAQSHAMVNAAVVRRGEVVAAAFPMDELQRSRIPFALKRVASEAQRRRGLSSHAEVVDDDLYAVSFWYGACLLGFFSAAYPVDFVRHRARLVIRELVQLLPELDDSPEDPAQRAPLPE